MALVLTMNLNSRIFIGDQIVITLCDVSRTAKQARLAIEAPPDIEVMRESRLENNDSRRQHPRIPKEVLRATPDSEVPTRPSNGRPAPAKGTVGDPSG